MGFFDDFADAIKTYPSSNVILSFFVVSPVGESLNEGEIRKASIKVTNKGHLNLTNLKFHVQGLNEAQVSLADNGPWETEIHPGPMTVPAHGSVTGASFYFKAPATTSAIPMPLFKAHISTFDVTLDDLLNKESGHADTPVITYTAQVYPE